MPTTWPPNPRNLRFGLNYNCLPPERSEGPTLPPWHLLSMPPPRQAMQPPRRDGTIAHYRGRTRPATYPDGTQRELDRHRSRSYERGRPMRQSPSTEREEFGSAVNVGALRKTISVSPDTRSDECQLLRVRFEQVWREQLTE